MPPRPEDSLQDLVSLYRPLILNADGTQAEREAELQTYTLDASLLTALQQRLGGSGDIPRTVTMWSLLLLGVKAREADGEESGRAARAVWQRITEAVGLRSETIIRLPAFSGRPELVAGKLETVLRRVLEAALGVTRPRT